MRVFSLNYKFDVDVKSDFLRVSIWVFLEKPDHSRFNIINNMLDSCYYNYDDSLAASLELGTLL